MGPGSHIIFFSTTQCAASTVTGAYLVYCASKGAVEQMVRILSKDLARKGVAVNCIAPGKHSIISYSELIDKLGTLSLERNR